MNMMMIDVTHIDGVGLGDEVVLLGAQGEDRIGAEDIAAWTGTINYEVISRIGVHVPRVGVDTDASPVVRNTAYRPPKKPR